MKLNRKLKKRIIKTFDKGTYVGIIQGYLTIKKYIKSRGVEIVYTGKPLGKYPYSAYQCHPYLSFKNIY